MAMTRVEIEADLTGPGGAFEVVTESVNGVEMKVYKERLPHLRAIAEIALARGDEREFIVYGKERIGFATFFARANAVSAALHTEWGVGSGDRVAVLSANNPEWCISFWATVDLGAILVGLNGWWKSDEVIYGLQDSGSKVLIADRKRFERIADRLDECPDLEVVFLIDAHPADLGLDDPRLRRFAELEADLGAPLPDLPIDEDDAAVIFYTSGTTGKPKGAISTHRSMVANLQNTMFKAISGAMLEATAEPRPGGGPGAGSGDTVSLLTSPLFHVSGCHSSLVVGTLAGVKVVMTEGKFEPANVLQIIQDERVTVWATVPTMVWRVCEHPQRHDYDTSSVTMVAFGGSPSAEELQRKVFDTFPNVRATTNSYGLTESSSVATTINGDDSLRKPDSVGPPVPVVDIKIIDTAGREAPTGSPGEVLIKGPIIMPGYWGKPEATASTVIDGWLHTGDIGHVDDEGFLYITDRAKDMIIRGGENIYCVEIEQRLVDHPDVADAAVIGVPHPELGEEVKAIVQVAPGCSLTDDGIRTWVRDALADFKVPTYVELTTDKLPRNASGKLLKNVLRGEGEVSFDETM
jgi:long-chain acyl-CoA synthetase